MRHLLVGLSTRGIAESAVKSCNNVITVDYFGDQDQKDLVSNISLARDYQLPFSAANLLKASDDLSFDTVSYTANMENHPNIVEALAKRAILAGNCPNTLRLVRNWSVLREFCREKSILHPLTLLPGEEKEATSDYKWLCKPVNEGGGHNIRFWDGRLLSNTSILQEYVAGTPASAAFVANGKRSVLIGMTRQLIGCAEFGVSGFSWCGNILPLTFESDNSVFILEEIENMLNLLTRKFGLTGVCGMDFVLSEDINGRRRPFLIEINPRYTASMELIEWAYGLNIFSLHMDACNGRLPDFNLAEHLQGKHYGKGVVFALKDLLIKNTRTWLGLGRRDIPFPGDKIKQGQPICTILAKADTPNTCLENLLMSSENLRQDAGDIRRIEWENSLL